MVRRSVLDDALSPTFVVKVRDVGEGYVEVMRSRNLPDVLFTARMYDDAIVICVEQELAEQYVKDVMQV